MSLFSSLQTGSNTLSAMQLGLQVVGQNISNSNTEGYIRERVIYTTAPIQEVGGLPLGTGVLVEAIVQNVDRFLETRLRDAVSDMASADVQEQAYLDLQAILGELTDTDISTALNEFFNDINQIANDSQSDGIRGLAVQSGVQLTTIINSTARRIQETANDFNSRINDLAEEINTLTDEISQLNYKIVNVEAGSNSEAGALRSQRGRALKELSQLIEITTSELDTGVVNISVGGELIVFEATKRDVTAVVESDEGQIKTVVRIADNNSPLSATGGELEGYYIARDTIFDGFAERLDEFAQTLIAEFNRVYSHGQGRSGFESLTGVEAVTDPDVALDAAGLKLSPTNGGFDLLIHNTDTDITERVHIPIDLNGIDGDTTLTSLAAAIDAADGVSASISLDNRLVIEAGSSEIEFAFDGDTSDVLAALGLNTFFTGSDAGSINVNQEVLSDPTLFAASLDGIGVDTQNIIELVNLNDAGLTALQGGTFTSVYDNLINETTRGATVAESVAEGFSVFAQSLEASSQAISGVNLDEEAIDMIMLQRTYQAAARYIATLSELLDVLVNL